MRSKGDCVGRSGEGGKNTAIRGTTKPDHSRGGLWSSEVKFCKRGIVMTGGDGLQTGGNKARGGDPWLK